MCVCVCVRSVCVCVCAKGYKCDVCAIVVVSRRLVAFCFGRPAALQAWHAAGAQVIVGVQSERFVGRVAGLAAASGWTSPPPVVQCDVSIDESLDVAFAEVRRVAEPTGGLSAVLHSVAHAPSSALKGPLSGVSRSDFASTMDVSAYSLLAVARRFAAVAHSDGGSLTSMTFHGAEAVYPNYGVMGPAKACLQACTQYLAVELVRATCRVREHRRRGS